MARWFRGGIVSPGDPNSRTVPDSADRVTFANGPHIVQNTAVAPDWWHGPYTSADAELVTRPTDVPTPTIPPRKQP